MTPSTLETDFQTAILDRAIGLESGEIPPEAARFIQSIRLSEEDVDRLNELAAKAREGTLSPEEEVAIEEYRRVGRLLEMLKLKARIALKQADSDI